MPFKKGNKLGKGGSHPGVSGPKPGWFKDWCAKAVFSEARLKRLEQILDKGSNDEFLEVFKYCAEMGHQAIKPAQSVALSGEMTQRRIIVNLPTGFTQNGNGHEPGRNGN